MELSLLRKRYKMLAHPIKVEISNQLKITRSLGNKEHTFKYFPVNDNTKQIMSITQSGKAMEVNFSIFIPRGLKETMEDFYLLDSSVQVIGKFKA